MGYLLLLIALLCVTTKGYCGKRASGLLQGYTGSTAGNLLRTTICTVIGFLLVLVNGSLADLKLSLPAMAVCALSGISTAASLLLWMVCVRKSAYVLMDVFWASGMLVPLILCSTIYGESVAPLQWLGIGLTLAAVLLMCAHHNSIKQKLTLSGVLLLLATGFSSGITDFSQKMIVNSFPQVSNAAFNFYTYAFAMTALAITFLVLRIRLPQEGGDLAGSFKKALPLLLIMAAALFGNSFFKTASAKYLTAAVLFPLSHGVALIFSSTMAAIFFKEKPTGKSILALVLIFIAMLLINL